MLVIKHTNKIIQQTQEKSTSSKKYLQNYKLISKLINKTIKKNL